MDTSELVKIELIKITICGKAIELKPDEARKLLETLNDLFGPKEAAPVHIPVPHYMHSPLWVGPNVEPWPYNWHMGYSGPVTCLACNIN